MGKNSNIYSTEIEEIDFIRTNINSSKQSIWCEVCKAFLEENQFWNHIHQEYLTSQSGYCTNCQRYTCIETHERNAECILNQITDKVKPKSEQNRDKTEAEGKLFEKLLFEFAEQNSETKLNTIEEIINALKSSYNKKWDRIHYDLAEKYYDSELED